MHTVLYSTHNRGGGKSHDGNPVRRERRRRIGLCPAVQKRRRAVFCAGAGRRRHCAGGNRPRANGHAAGAVFFRTGRNRRRGRAALLCRREGRLGERKKTNAGRRRGAALDERPARRALRPFLVCTPDEALGCARQSSFGSWNCPRRRNPPVCGWNTTAGAMCFRRILRAFPKRRSDAVPCAFWQKARFGGI